MMADSLEYVDCPGCGCVEAHELADEAGLGIKRCQSCELVYVSPRLRENQGHYHGTLESIERKYGAVLRGEAAHNRDPNYRQELEVLARFRPEGRLLDVGTHCGFFLRMARGMRWELHGVEPSPAAELAARYFGLNVHRGTLEELAFDEGSFDVVTLIDVIEHLDGPHGLLSEVRRIMTPNGIVFIKTPNARYNLFKYRLFRRALRLANVEIFDAKEHVVQYTLRTLARTLEEAGLAVAHHFVPLPIQDGAAWKCGLRASAWRIAGGHHYATGRFGPLAPDIAVVAIKRDQPLEAAA